MFNFLHMCGLAAEATLSTTASWDLYETIQALFQAPSYHLVFEAALILWIVGLLFTKSYSSKVNKLTLTDKEKADLVEEWQPEPLVPNVPEDDPELINIRTRIVDSKLGKYVTLNGQKCLNMASLNFLAMVGKEVIEEEAVKSLKKYGVGACGPRGFYGTVDVHLEEEEKLAQFMGTEEAIVYSYGFATIASAIPAYSKRGDIIFCDEGVCFAIQKGIQASRSKVKMFRHNDTADLERLLTLHAEEERKDVKKARVTRKFLIVEGLYVNYGDICPLPKLMELKWKYKLRLFMDESISFGTLGKTGRGVTEHFNVPIDDVDFISASLENALGSFGGFGCGKSYVIDHQRLSGLGYCFSASTPPMLSQAAIVALDLLKNTPDMVDRLHANSAYLHEKLSRVPGLRVVGDTVSPVLHLQLAESDRKRASAMATLRCIVQMAEEEGVALVVASYLEKDERHLPPPSIRLAVNCDLDEKEMDRVVEVIDHACLASSNS
ncbi:hypothetical protein NP493_49g10016 [Ridgeia piscesae]|uniref:Serine palmitoyltransferase 1 n=1 Tax=Ridgeia piscesae TaxID=27915 RepID=A0AAD9PB27_RIDPI|nr:hypothetical protein NP493_49g10016 [Ridgeia piscesae]